MAFAGPFIISLYGVKFNGAVMVFQLYLLPLLMRLTQYMGVIRATGHTGHVLINVVVFSICNFVLSIIFVKKIGLLGPAIATIISVYLAFSLVILQLSILMGMPIKEIFPWRQLSYVLITAILPIFIAFPVTLVFDSPITKLIVGAVVYAVLYLMASWRMGFLTSNDLQVIHNIIMRKK